MNTEQSTPIDPVADIIDRISNADSRKLKDIYEREIPAKGWSDEERKIITDKFWMKATRLNWISNQTICKCENNSGRNCEKKSPAESAAKITKPKRV